MVHEIGYYAVIKNDLTDVYEYEKMFRINESNIAKDSAQGYFPPSIRLDQVLCYISYKIFYFPYIKQFEIIFMFN